MQLGVSYYSFCAVLSLFKPRSMIRWLLRLLGLGVVLASMASAWMVYFAHQPIKLKSSPADFTVPAGSSLRRAATQIEQAGIDLSSGQFTLLARLLGKASSVKAGSYRIETGITPLELLDKLTRGDVMQADILFVEGWTFWQLRAALDAHPDLRHDTAGLDERQILDKLGIEGRAEGWFFPDTYLFAKGSSDLDVLKRAHAMMMKALTNAWEGRDAGLPYATPYEALIMASIVEKETGQAPDRPLIAAVFTNRLKKGMLLQTDPTVIYGLGVKFDGNLRKRDLLTDGPYNTYTRPGLPPTPIAMPGLASLQAVMHPARTDVLYFVARGDGSSQFSRTLDEHNRAVTKYQLRKGQ